MRSDASRCKFAFGTIFSGTRTAAETFAAERVGATISGTRRNDAGLLYVLMANSAGRAALQYLFSNAATDAHSLLHAIIETTVNATKRLNKCYFQGGTCEFRFSSY